MGQLSRKKLYEIEKVANFRDLLNRSERLYSNKTAFIYKKNPKSTDYITHTYSDLKHDVENLGTSLLNMRTFG